MRKKISCLIFPNESPSMINDEYIEQAFITKGGFLYKYRINFKLKHTPYIVSFTDKTGDKYNCICFRKGWHYIDYNSHDAIIEKISVYSPFK